MKNLTAIATAFLTSLSFAGMANEIWIGNWVGIATTASEETSVTLLITESNELLTGAISLDDIGVAGWPMSSIVASASELHITLPSDSGIQNIDLLLSNSSLTGTWRESGVEEVANIRLKKSTRNNQTSEKMVLIDGPAGKIGASIIAPTQKGPVPAIVFVHGSGPQPRDSSRFAAQRFAELGIASIIYDKRGVGETEGTLSGVTFESLAADAIAVAEYMSSQANTLQIGFSGHSQGGWVSTLAASSWVKTSFLITSAGPAVPPAREAHWTVVRAMRKNNNGEIDVQEARKVIEYWHLGIRTGNWARFDDAYAQAKKQTWFKGSDLVYFGQKPGEEYGSSYRAFMDYDPLPAIKSLDVPYLAILSPNDESIDAIETREILEQLQKPNISLKLYTGFDHSMRRLGEKGNRLRWPEHPEDYFQYQFKFISDAVKKTVR